MKKVSWKKLSWENLKGKVFVIPTDTIYGFSCLSFDDVAIKKLYQIKKQDLLKPSINLISSLKDLDKFGIELNKKQKKFLKRIWPAQISVILKNEKDEKVSFRMPKKRKLRKFISKVGPIISTSFNFHGKKYQKDLSQIEKFEGVDYFIDEGLVDNGESIILEILR